MVKLHFAGDTNWNTCLAGSQCIVSRSPTLWRGKGSGYARLFSQCMLYAMINVFLCTYVAVTFPKE